MRQPGGIIIVFILALISAGFFNLQILHPPEAAAAGPSDIIINEIMYDAEGSDTDNEWVEIYNAGAETVTIVESSGTGSWRFNDGSNHIFTLARGSLTMAPAGFAIIASNGEKFIADHPSYTGTVLDTVMSLNNTTDTLKLSADKGVTFFGDITYQSAWGGNGNGKTLERQNDSWAESAVAGGTPGAVNSAVSNPPISPLPRWQDNTATSTPEQTDNNTASSTSPQTLPPTPPF